jgi:hypothetical protein
VADELGSSVRANDRVGAYLGTVAAPWLADDVVAGVVEDPVTAVQRVGVFRLRRR